MRTSSFAKRISAILMAVAVTTGNYPVPIVYADDPVPLELDVNGQGTDAVPDSTGGKRSAPPDNTVNPGIGADISSIPDPDAAGGVRFSIPEGFTVDPDSVSFFVVKDGKEETLIHSFDEATGTYTVNAEAGMDIRFLISQPAGSKYADITETVHLEKDPVLVQLEFAYKQTPELDCGTLNIPYGNGGVDVLTKVQAKTGYDGDITVNSNDAGSVIRIDGTTVIPVLPGDAEICIHAEETGFFYEESITVTVHVIKKDLGTLAMRDIQWDIPEKTYDGSAEIPATGTVPASAGVINGDTVSVRAILSASSPNAGEQATSLSFWAVTEGDSLYTFSINPDNGPAVTIKKAPAEVSAAALVCTYGDEAWAALRNGSVPASCTTSVSTPVANDTVTAELAAIDPAAYAELSVSAAPAYTPGTYPGALRLAVKNPENCNFSFSSAGDADIAVRNQLMTGAEIWQYIRENFTPSPAAFEEDGSLWGVPGTSVSFTPKSEQQLYDRILFGYGDSSYENAAEFPSGGNSGAWTVQLTHSGDSGVATDSDSMEEGAQPAQLPDVIRPDGDAPEISFSDSNGVYGTFTPADGSPVSFSKYAKEGLSVLISVSDNGSGVKAAEQKTVFAAPSADPAQAVQAAVSDNLGWESVPENGKVDIPATDEGYYILLVRAADRAGNTALLSSEGIVVDTTAPGITVSGADENRFYNAATDIKVTVSDDAAQGTGTGVAAVTVYANEGDDPVYAWEEDEGALSPTSTHEATVPVSPDLYGQDAEMRITATDRAGNMAETVRTVHFDTVPPSVTVAYDNNDAKNGSYFNAPRTLTVTYTERNFDPENAGLAVTINGKSVTARADALSGYGIELVSGRQDSEPDGNAAHTDGRTNTYVYKFGAGITAATHYTVMPYITDPAGNEGTVATAEGTAAPYDFTVSTSAADVSAAFESAGKPFTAAGEPGGAIAKEAVTMHISVDDPEFTADGISVTAVRRIPGNADVNVNTEITWDGSTGSCAPFRDDGRYEISIRYTDRAGNTSQTGPLCFTLDASGPEGHVSMEYDGKTASSRELQNAVPYAFTNGNVSFTCTASDALTGTSAIRYAVYTPEPAGARTAVLPGNFAGSLAWTDYTGAVTAEPGTAGLFVAEMTDAAGNKTYVNAPYAFVSETTAPELALTLPEKQAALYSGAVSAAFTVSDTQEDGTASGIAGVRWTVSADGEVTQSGNCKEALKEGNTRKTTFSGTVEIDPELNNSNNVTVTVTATDYCGNTSVRSAELGIDTTAPHIRVRADGEALNERYFNSDRTITVEYTARNFDPDAAGITVEANGVRFDMKAGTETAPGMKLSSSSETDAENGMRTYTYVYAAGCGDNTDTDYVITPYMTDAAGKACTDIVYEGIAAQSFTVDKASPVLTASYSRNGSAFTPGETDGTVFSRTPVTAAFTVSERNASENIAVNVSAADLQGNPVSTEAAGQWNGNTYTLPAFTQDAVYTVSAAYTDLAGNAAVTETARFTKDSTPPAGKITASGKDFTSESDSLSSETRFGIFTDSSVEFSYTAEDPVSGIASVACAVYDPGQDASGTFALPDADGLEELEWTQWTENVIMRPDSQAVFFIRLQDKAGNIAYINAKQGIIADATAPDGPSVSITAGERDIYCEDVPVSVSVQDAVNGGTYSGLKDVRYEIRNEGRVTKSGSFADRFSDPSARVRAFTETVVVPAAENGSGTTEITVTAEDYAGNVSSASKHLSIDTSEPYIEIFYDNNDVRNGRYFNRARTMTAVFHAKNFDPGLAGFEVTVNGNTVRAAAGDLSGYGIRTVAGRSDSESGQPYTEDRTNTYVYAFGEGVGDADYRIVPFMTTAAGKECTDIRYGNTAAGQEFTVDTTAPVVAASYTVDGNGVVPGTDEETRTWHAGILTASWAVTERNMDKNRTETAVQAKTGAGSALPFSANGQWADSTYSVPFATDANYTLGAVFRDLAGNETAVPDVYFTVDTAAPDGTLSILPGTGKKDSSAYAETAHFGTFSASGVQFSYTADDATSGIGDVSCAFYNPGKEASGEFPLPGINDLQSLNWEEWGQVAVSPDSQAILLVRLRDKAGNTAYISAADGVIAETTPPDAADIRIGTEEREIYNSDIPVTMTVTDPENGNTWSGLKSVRWEVSTGGTVTQSGDSGQALADPAARIRSFTQDVTVRAALNNSNAVKLTVYAEDNAGNTSSASKTFRIDTTAPFIAVSYDLNDPENKKYFKAARTMTVTYHERNFDPEKAGIRVLVNGTAHNIRAGSAGVYGVSLKEGRTDSESTGTPTDSRTNTYTYVFGAEEGIEADFEVEPYIEDAAGNVCGSVSYNNAPAAASFTVDKKAPVIVPAYRDGNGTFAPGTSTDSFPYRTDSVSAEYTVTETNFDAKGFSLSASGLTADGKGVPLHYSGAFSGKTFSTVFGDEANYRIGASFTDLAGNTAVLQDAYFAVDKTAPSGRLITDLSSGEKVSERLSTTMRFGTFAKTKVGFRYEASDATAGIAQVHYSVYVPAASAKGDFEVPGPETVAGMDWTEWDENASVLPDSQAVLYIRIADKAGNITYLNAADGVIAEATAPEAPAISIEPGKEKEVYGENIPVTLSVTDPESGGTWSGLKSVRWEIRKDGVKTQEGNYNYELVDPAARVQSVTHQETILAERNNSNNTEVLVWAEDYSGNASSASRTFRIDTTPPSITVAFDNNDVRNGKYFNRPRTMTVTFTERNFDPAKAGFIITDRAGTRTVRADELSGYGITPAEAGTDSWNGQSVPDDGRTHTYAYTFGAAEGTDADYEIHPFITDAAGNMSTEADYGNSKAGSAFTVDRVSPVLSLTAVKEGHEAETVTEGTVYHRAPVSASVSVTERNFSENGLETDVTGTDAAGAPAAVAGTGTWEGQTYRISRCETDANYRISAAFEDLAGNRAEMPARYFTVDTAGPTGRITTRAGDTVKEDDTLSETVRYGVFSNSKVSFEYSASDATSGVRSVKYAFHRPPAGAHGEFSVPGAQEAAAFDWQDWNNVEINPESQAVLYVRLEDAAGNVTYLNAKEGVIAETAAPAGPGIRILTEEKQVYDTDVPVRFIVEDAENGGNYSGLAHIRWEVRADGKQTQTGNRDREFMDSSARVRSYSFDETVDASLNNSDNVEIYVEASDYAGNTATFTKTIAIDTTVPGISVRFDNNAPENGKYFKTARTMTVTFRERNFDPQKAGLMLTVNGHETRMPADRVSAPGVSLLSVTKADAASGFSDMSEYIYTYLFGNAAGTDADYRVIPYITDAAGNTAGEPDYGNSAAPKEFTVDMVPPAIAFTCTSDGAVMQTGTSEASMTYTRKAASGEFAVTERNFTADTFRLSVRGTDANGAAIAVNHGGQWDGKTYKDAGFSKDANYNVSAEIKDLAGNTAVSGPHYFCVDKTAPSGTVITTAGNIRKESSGLASALRFGTFSNSRIRFAFNGTDAVSGIAGIMYTLYDPGKGTAGTFAVPDADALAQLPWTVWDKEMEILPDRQAVLFARVEDRAGNITYINAEDGTIAEATAPEPPQITIETAEKAVYGGDIPFTISVADPEHGGTWSGIASLTWKVLCDGKVTQEDSCGEDLQQSSRRLRTYSCRGTVEASKNNSNRVEIAVEVTDYAGNVNRASKQLAIDTTAPEITVLYGSMQPKNGKYFNEARSMTVVFRDRNFDPEKAGLMLTVNGQQARCSIGSVSGQGIVMTEGRKDTDPYARSDARENSYTFLFGAGGPAETDYTVVPYMEDTAGNVCAQVTYNGPAPETEFTVDTVAPVVTVSCFADGTQFDAGDPESSVYKKTPVTVQYAVAERNFTESIRLHTTASDFTGNPVRITETGKWDGKTYTAGPYADNANYVTYASVTDLAGNTVQSGVSRFTADMTAPEGTLTVLNGDETSDSSSLGQKKEFSIFSSSEIGFDYKASDKTSGIASVMYAFYVPETDAKGRFSVPSGAQAESLPWRVWDGQVSLKPDSQAVAYLRLQDRAGNVAYINAADAAISENTAPDLPVIRFEVEGISVYGGDVPFTVALRDPENGGTYSGIRSALWQVICDGKVTQSGTVSGEGLEPSIRTGAYTFSGTMSARLNNSNSVKLRVSVEDNAGNTSESERTLAIDTTKPVLTASWDDNSPRNGKYFNHARNLTVKVNERNIDEDRSFIFITANSTKYTCALRDASAYGVTKTEDAADSQRGYAQQERTDARVIQYSYAFGASGDTDADYSLAFLVTDLAGNVTEEAVFPDAPAQTEFTVDEVMPVLTRSFTDGNGRTVAASEVRAVPVYDRASFGQDIRVEERNFAETGLDVALEAYDYTGTQIQGIAESGTWEHTGTVHKYTSAAYTADANYHTRAVFTDLAGNTAYLPWNYFTVDTQPPEGKLITVTDGKTAGESSSLKTNAAFDVIGKNAVMFRQENSDKTSGVAGVSYSIYDPGTDAKGSFALPRESALAGMGWQPWTNYTVLPDGQAVLLLRLTDYAGNVRYISSSGGVIADATAPDTPQISITLDTDRSVYGGDVPFRVTATDPVKGGTYAGLADVSWTITADGTETQSQSYASELADKTARVQNMTRQATVLASLNNSNDIVITAEATDYAGNTSRTAKRICIDTTPPEITVSYDNNAPVNGNYFNSARTMTVTFRDRNFDPAGTLAELSVNGDRKTVPVTGIAGYGIQSAGMGQDSQAGRGLYGYTDERTHTYTFTFGAGGNTDADYAVSFTAADAAGNKSGGVDYGKSNPQSIFTVDEIAPILSMSFTNGSGASINVSTDENRPTYDRVSMTATASVTERNFTAGGLYLEATSRNNGGTPRPYAVAGTWTGSGNRHSYRTDPFAADGIYSISGTYTDLAGNTASFGKRHFTVDRTAPAGGVTVNTKGGNVTFDKLNDKIAFRIFTNEPYVIHQSSADTTSGIASVQYCLYTPPVETRGTFNGPSLQEMPAMKWTDWNGDITVQPDRQAVLYVRLADRAGNVKYMNSPDGIIADKTAPAAPVITVTAPETGSVHNRDVPVTIHVSDPESGGTYAGLKSVKWTVTANGKVTQSGSFDQEFSDRTARKQETEHEITVKAASNNSDRVTVTVTAADYAENTAKAEKAMAIDTDKPEIEVTYDLNDPVNGKYFNAKRTATVTVRERNFDPEKVRIICKSEEGNEPETGKWEGVGKDNPAVHTCKVVFAKDGTYEFTVEADDAAGNKGKYSRTDSFVIDTTPPVIRVQYDENNKDSKNVYYNKTRTAVVVIEETNFSKDLFKAAMSAQGDTESGEQEGHDSKARKGQDKRDEQDGLPEAKEWTEKDSMHGTMYEFSEEGRYAYELTCTDLAGNTSEPFAETGFVIDKTPPSVTISGVEDRSANKGKVAPAITYEDINFNQDGLRVTLTGASHKPVTPKGETVPGKNSATFQIPDFVHKQSADDMYTLKAEASDLAGNKTETSISFSVNRYGSVFTFSEDTEEFLEHYYAGEGHDLTIYETNVDGLVNNGIQIARDGNVVPLEKNKEGGYTAKMTESGNGRTVWTYTIGAEHFKEEGLYEVRIESTDKAGNRQDNNLKGKPIAFAIDRTAPAVNISGIENNGRYKETYKDMAFTVTDNMSADRAEMYLDGKLIRTFSADELAKSDGKGTYRIGNSEAWQSVEIVAYDRAGNKGTSDKISVFVSTDPFRQFLANKALLYSVIGITAGGAGGLALFLVLKKRREKRTGRGKTKPLNSDPADTSDDLA